MKKVALIVTGLVWVFSSFGQEEMHKEEAHVETTQGEGKLVPSVQLKDMDGKTVNTAELGLKGPVIISFWATWCSPCKRELNTIHDLYEDWQAETGVTLVAVSIDDEKTKSGVPVYVDGKSWEYLVLMDVNSDFKRAMGVNNVPHTFLVDATGKIVYSHNNYAPGDEDKLYAEVLKLTKK
jgi:cytochrome c biogenesis protein CcmG, thiol:disulfide interchange protein DsbE